MATVVGSLVFEMAANVARLQSDMQKARGTVNTAMDGIRGAAAMAAKALAAVGVGLSAKAFGDMVLHSLEAVNAMHELGLRTGQTVEALSSLKPAARASGTDMDLVAKGLQKLSKAMYEVAETGKGKAAAAFEELGIKIVDANGKLRDNATVMKEVAEKLDAMDNKTRAVALAQVIFSKAGANLLPFMKELAEQAELHATIFTKDADAAHAFHIQLAELTARSDGLKRELALGLLPAMQDILTAFTDMTKAQNDVRGFFETVGTLARGLATAVFGVWTALRGIGEVIAVNLAVADRLVHLDFKGALNVLKDAAEQAAKIAQGAKSTVETINGIKTPAASGAPASGAAGPAPSTDPWLNYEFGGTRAAGGGVDAGKTYLVGENGPELFTPGASGGITPNGAGGASSVEDFKAIAEASAKVVEHVKKMGEELRNTKQRTEDLGTVFERSAVNAIKNFRSLQGLVKNIAADLLGSLQKQASTGVQQGLGELIGAAFGGGRASGGGVDAGTTYLVGENGPELFTPGSSGGITPNGALGGGGDMHVTINAPGADAAALARVQAELRALRQSFNGLAVGAVRQYLTQRGSSAFG